MKQIALHVLFAALLVPALVPQEKPMFVSAEVAVSGEVRKPLYLTLESFRKMKSVIVPDAAVTDHVGNRIGMASGFRGVLLREILDSAEIGLKSIKDASSLYIVAQAADGYKAVYSAHEIFNTDIGDSVYVCFEQHGDAIDAARGGGFRMLSLKDHKTGPRHLKWLKRLDVREVKQ